MSLYRFHVPALGAGRVELPPEEGHHARHVLRLETDALVELFDGKGAWATGKIEVNERGAAVDVERLEHSPRPPLELTLATAVPKGDRAEWLIEQASQLNAWAVQWVDADRGVVKPREDGGKMEKFHRLAVESAKQCGRNWLMDVRPMRPLRQVAAEAAARGERVWWLEQSGTPVMDEVARLRRDPTSAGPRITALIGPEGGWSEEEARDLAAMPGVVRVRLTPTILRVETACAAVAALAGAMFDVT